MSNIRHILRLHTQKWSNYQIAGQTGMPLNILNRHIREFKKSGLSFEEINELNDKDLEELFSKPKETPLSETLQELNKLFPKMNRELRRKGVTQQLLWQEYKTKHPNGVGRSQFNFYFCQWKSRIVPTMRREHKAGDKLYIDFAGERLTIIDKETGKTKPVEVFVAILGASQLTYVKAVMSQRKEDFICVCEDALQYYGGVPAAIVPDNLRSAVTKSHKYEPTINETFADFAEHYNTTILPARAYKPKDKALVEIAIRIIYTRIYARLRNMDFSSLEELNKSIEGLLEEHNNQIINGRDYSRRQRFEKVERNTLLPLPALRYEFKKQHFATVMKNSHVALTQDKHYYSVPYSFIGKKVKVMYSQDIVEIFYNYDRIATHKRLKVPFDYTTDKEHLPPSHRFVSEWTAERFITWADEIHKDVKLYITQIINQKKHPEQAYKLCLGVLNLSKKVGNERLSNACRRALDYGIYNYKIIKKILEKGLDQFEDEEEKMKMPQHDNIRGEDYYQ